MLQVDIPHLTEFKALAAVRGAPCLSIYMPTSHVPSDAIKNRTAFKDLAKEALRQLGEAPAADGRHIEAVSARLDPLLEDDPIDVQDRDHIRKLQRVKPQVFDEFWSHQASGVGVLASTDLFRTFRLPYGPQRAVEVADRFHLAPLVRAMTSHRDALVLALSENGLRLLQVVVNLPAVEVKVSGLPRDVDSMSHRGERAGSYLPGREGRKVLIHVFVQRAEDALHHALASAEQPLILAATEPLASMYRAVNRYRGLLAEDIAANPDHMSDAHIADAAVGILERLYAGDLGENLALYDQMKPRRATTDVSYAARAATAGAIDRLVVDFDVILPGFVSDMDGSVTYAASDDAEAYSVLDEVAKRAICTGAKVLGARHDELPDRAALLAILRYPL